jgi:hypothetical protein
MKSGPRSVRLLMARRQPITRVTSNKLAPASSAVNSPAPPAFPTRFSRSSSTLTSQSGQLISRIEVEYFGSSLGKCSSHTAEPANLSLQC